MKLSGRLRDVRFGLGGYKYQTNIRYLQSAEKIISGYKWFVTEFCNGKYQYQRLHAFFELLDQGRFVPMEAKGFGNLGLFLKMIIGNKAALWQMTQRMARFVAQPSNVYWALRAFLLALSSYRRGGIGYFQFWFFAWTNAVLKYRYISDDDFDIENVEDSFDIKEILPADYKDSATEAIPPQKIKAQLRATMAQLKTVISERSI